MLPNQATTTASCIQTVVPHPLSRRVFPIFFHKKERRRISIILAGQQSQPHATQRHGSDGGSYAAVRRERIPPHRRA
jgi:hypothetical protein